MLDSLLFRPLPSGVTGALGAASSAAVAVLATCPLLAQPLFVEVADSVGLGVDTYVTAHDHGLGLVWIDYDADGHRDLFVTNGFGRSPHLFHNEGDGTFTLADHLLPAFSGHELMGAVFADYDGDGDSDLYVYTDNESMTTLDGPPNLLLENRWVESGGGDVPLFVDVAAQVGVDDLPPVPFGPYPGYRTTAASWLDYDRDGDVDLFVAHWNWLLPGDPSAQDRLYRNDGGLFTDVTAAAGLHTDPAGDGLRSALVALGAHLDGDLWPDLYVGNVRDPSPFHHDLVYRNAGDGTFVDVTGSSPGVGDDAEAVMGIGTADVDLDGDWDVYLSDLFNTTLDAPPLGNVLYLGNGDLTFADNSAPEAGVDGAPSWGVSFLDADQDGWEDLFVGVIGADQDNLFYWNSGDGTFGEIGVAAGVATSGNARGSAVADYDRDGDLDLAVVNQNGRLRLYENVTPGQGHWLQLALAGTVSNRDAIGTMVEVTAGGVVRRRQVVGGTSTHSQDSPVLHFGLGAESVAERVDVLWPSGLVNSYSAVSLDQRLELVERPTPFLGLYAPSIDRFMLRNSLTQGSADIAFSVDESPADPVPVAGDWDGDLAETVGLYDRDLTSFFLWNDHQGGAAEVVVALAPPAADWMPVAGDWDGDGVDGLGLFDLVLYEFQLWNGLGGGPPDLVFSLQPNGTGWLPIAGDWDGDGVDTVGIYTPEKGLFVLAHQNGAGGGTTLRLGPSNAPGWTPLAGDWNGDGLDTVGLYRPDVSRFLLDDDNDGVVDLAVRYGKAGQGAMPVVGAWVTRVVP